MVSTKGHDNANMPRLALSLHSCTHTSASLCPLWLHAPLCRLAVDFMATLTSPLWPSQQHAPSLCPSRPLSPHFHGPCGGTHYVAVPLTAACTMLLCSFYWLTLYSYISFFHVSANLPFCILVTVLSPPFLPIDVWVSSPLRAYHSATTNYNNSGIMVIMQCYMATMWLQGCDDMMTMT